MSDAPILTPQEPGVLPGTDSAKLDAIAAGKAGEFVEALPALTDDELAQLTAIETQGKARSTALGAIVREQQRREADRQAPATGATETTGPTPVGDDSSYARMHANEIDPRRLTRPVLTLDGWLLPVPSAQPQE